MVLAPSHLELHRMCSTGNIQDLRHFLDVILPSLPRDQQRNYCIHAGSKCDDVPCPAEVENLADQSAEAAQSAVFRELWDTYLGPRGFRLPWRSLYAAARLGSVDLAKIFHDRDPDCFNIVEPAAPHGDKGGGLQLQIAVRGGHLEYAAYMLAMGAQINKGFPKHSPVRAAVQYAVSDGKGRFLHN